MPALQGLLLPATLMHLEVVNHVNGVRKWRDRSAHHLGQRPRYYWCNGHATTHYTLYSLYVLGEALGPSSCQKRQGGTNQKTAAVYNRGRVEKLSTLLFLAKGTKEHSNLIPRKRAVAQWQLQRRILCKDIQQGEQVLSSWIQLWTYVLVWSQVWCRMWSNTHV